MVSGNYTTSVLLALSDAPILTVISYHLERYGFIVNSCRTTENLLESIERIEPSILILDEDLAGNSNASDVCSFIRSKSKIKDVNVILASKSLEVDDKLINDRVSKPFAPSELVNKIKALAKKEIVKTQKILSYHDIEMNVNAFKVSRFGKPIHLGPTEFKILQCLLELPGRVLSREHIMNYVWGYNSQVEQRTIDVHINRLRSALKDNEDDVPLIRTIRAAGYSLNMPRELVRV